MNQIGDWIQEPAHDIRVAAEADVVVVGGGPAGQAAALAAARNGASVTLLERYNHLGGLASGGMVLVLDDMWDNYQKEISVRGICIEMIERMAKWGLAEYPKQMEWGALPESVQRWRRWGTFDFHSKEKPNPICFAAAFDPDAFKRAALEMVQQAGINLRLHSWFSRTLVEGDQVRGVVVESKSGREAILGKVVIDATGDLDVAASAGAPHFNGTYIVTTVFRLGGIDTVEAERFEYEEPQSFATIDREIKHLLGGAWDAWWLKTPLPGVVWCNCPHMSGLDGLKVSGLTRAEVLGRATIHKLIEFIRTKLPGFKNCYLIDLAPQTGVRQTRLLDGEYVITKDDVMQRIRFQDSVARGRDYYYPYRSLVPRNVDNLLVAGRHYSSTSAAQKLSREIPPCMAMGEAAGTAAAVSLESGVAVRHVDISRLQKVLRAQGADPGDQSGPNADVPSLARSFTEVV